MEKDTFNQLVQDERMRQDKKWGEQNHEPFIWLAILGEEVGELNKSILERRTLGGGILPDIGQMEKELIQITAVCKAMWESGKRNNWL